MKRSVYLIIIGILASLGSYAGGIWYLPVDNQESALQIKKNPNIEVFYQSDAFLLTGVEPGQKFNAQLLVQDYDKSGKTLYVVWFHKQSDPEYISTINQEHEILIKGQNYLILLADSGIPVAPPVNGRIVHVSGKPVAKTVKPVSWSPEAVQYDPEIEAMMNEVDTNIYIGNVQHLQDYGTRNCYTPQAVQAQNWIKQQYEEMGYEVTLFDFSMPGGSASDNVIAKKTGTKYPDEYVVIGGHYDSYSYSGNAPGADDDASGACGVMEVARVMSNFDTDRTVLFCAWSGEEYGLYGSEAWAEWAATQGLDILGYFNMDMIGYLQPGSYIHTDMIAPASAQPLIDFYTNVCALYLPDFPVEPGSLSGGDSDHTSFNNAGYMGIFPFEDSQNYSPYIHSPNDLIGQSLNNPEQAMIFIQAMVANVATMANFLAPPDNLVVIGGDQMVELSWDPLAEIDYYNVYRDMNPDPIATTTDPQYTDTDVVNFTTYSYYVTAVYSETGEESDPSQMVEVTPVPAMVFPFIDDFESNAPYWQMEGSWGLATNQYVSPSHSLTESPQGDYANNLMISATLHNFSLENATSAQLSFKTKYALEANYDYMWLEISTDGVNFTELDEFNGFQNNWIDKTYDLSSYLGEPVVFIRFRFYSDVYVTEDGMYIDDFQLNVENIGTTGINRTNWQGVTVSPNPATDKITLSGVRGPVQIELFNSQGELVQKSYSGSEGELSLLLDNSLKNGIYFLKLENKECSYFTKVVIKK
ncbi:MAG: hypothetical protein Kow00127_05710 [Bacteroidales bacterium]